MDYYVAHKTVKPLYDELKKLEQDAKLNVERGEETAALIQQLEQSIASYNEDHTLLVSEAMAIKADMENVQSKVDRSSALLDSFAAAKGRWECSSETIRAQMATIVGDTLLAAAFLAYAGNFDEKDRQSLLSSWSKHLGVSFFLYFFSVYLLFTVLISNLLFN